MTLPLRHEGLVRVLALPTMRDSRGDLIPITFADWGFEAVRSFVVRATAGTVRGGHGHRLCRQVFMRVSGVVDVDVRIGESGHTIRLDGDTSAVLIEPGVWAQQTYVTDDAALVVFADMLYDPSDYVDVDRADTAAPPDQGGPA